MNPHHILVVDDETKMQRILCMALGKIGYRISTASNGREALAKIDQSVVDVVITDLKMPEMDGMQLLSQLRERGDDTPVIMVTAFGSVDSAVAAMKSGASDYLIRPFELESVELAVERALALRHVQQQNRYLKCELERGKDALIGAGAAMQEVQQLIKQVSMSKASVLLIGETGTGKELAARAIHSASGRKGLFVPINCAAIPAEILEGELFGHSKGAFTGAHRDRVGKIQ